MLHGFKQLTVLSPLCATWLAVASPAPLTAQEGGQENPRVERLTFRGVDALDERELRRSIATEQTRCRSVLLRPLCWVTDWGLFVEKNYLDREELARDELRLEVRYFRRGWREALVESELRPRGRGVEVIFTVAEGEPTRIVEAEVEQTAEVLSRRELRWARVPAAGDPLDLIRIDSAVAELRRSAKERGYLDVVIRDTAAVDRAERRARLDVTIVPGPRSTLEAFDIEGNEDVTDRTIQRATILREGRVIRLDDLTLAQRSLYESNLFHEARIEVPEQADSAKRLQVRVREAPPRQARVGGGLNTAEFVQTEGRLSHYNFLGGGRRVEIRTAVGNLLAGQLGGRPLFRDVVPEGELLPAEEAAFLRPTWQAGIDLRQPGFRSAENALGAGVFAHRRLVPGVAVDLGHGADLTFTRLLRDRSPLSLSYRFELNRVRAGDLYFCVNYGICDLPSVEAVRRPRRLSPLGASFIRERHDDPLNPVLGWRTRLDVEHASAATLSDFSYHRVSGALAHYWPRALGRQVIAGRVRAGWVRPLGRAAEELGLPDFEGELLHPRKRFFAGGAESVRGYGENQLGPRILTISPRVLTDPEEGGCTPAQLADRSCDPNRAPVDAFQPRPLGGTYVLQGNAEYRFPLWRELQGAVFVDGAIVGGREQGRIGRGTWGVTPGFGARYLTPIGPVRIDLGIRPRTAEELRVVTELVDDAGERRIVLLDTPRRYDPLAETDGILGNVLGRLRLHISIGQAF
jgi:outer membrane protein assembly factor BamA